MPIVKAKSLENINAANLLVKHGMFAASVHCSYYSGFQLSKYVLSQYCAITYKKQEDESRGMDSHFLSVIRWAMIYLRKTGFIVLTIIRILEHWRC